MIARTTNVSRSGGTCFYLYGHTDLPVPPDQLWRCNWIMRPDLPGDGVAA